MTPQEYQTRIRELENKLEQEREEKLWWRDQLRGPLHIYLDPVLGITSKESAIVLSLYKNKGRLLSKQALLSAIVGMADDEPELKIIDVFVCKTRAKLKLIDVSIDTVWGQGYVMSPLSARRLSAFVMGEDHDK